MVITLQRSVLAAAQSSRNIIARGMATAADVESALKTKLKASEVVRMTGKFLRDVIKIY